MKDNELDNALTKYLNDDSVSEDHKTQKIKTKKADKWKR